MLSDGSQAKVGELSVSRKGDYAAGSGVAGFTLSRLGGGYVVQKWRPHFGQTQNWSGVHGMSGPGSRMSICVPHRMQRIWMPTSVMSRILAYKIPL